MNPLICTLWPAYLLDRLLGDPTWLPHPVVGFGKAIGFFEKRWNRGRGRFWKGMAASLLLTSGSYLATRAVLWAAETGVSPWLRWGLSVVLAFFCLAGTTLIREVRETFHAVDRSIEEGRRQVGRIVGRDTSSLSRHEVEAAALETLSENLSDGVIAPLVYFCLGGVPLMMAYKMVNTLDSMTGYRNERYRDYGCFAARMDDVVNWVPARLTALVMLAVTCRWRLVPTVWSEGKRHLSPNSGYPEAALAAILDCRFGGAHVYFGEVVEKPYIGRHDRPFCLADMERAVCVNRRSEMAVIVAVSLLSLIQSVSL